MSAALRLHGLARKAGFDPNQPRVPRGHPDGGQWTRTDGSRASESARRDEGGNTRVAQNESGDEPPEIPKQRPPPAKARNAVIKSIAG